jgi:hypothetical protein
MEFSEPRSSVDSDAETVRFSEDEKPSTVEGLSAQFEVGPVIGTGASAHPYQLS